ncbi:hypothetical protein HXX76_014067 [Chlamydomonas incerta]|uniref:Uncharacterized protein n=1 Tax=Chlamydomonas incerta TaxID=51695 RepID=A0A835SMD4_CHLIN|nr:hypothetical protein HXX76_014067 [Chlamydomonas incerta]|eukprot:KAG2424909.1 hypothetical protein HXX76_014067 [Chlamydomonas incerta]
MDLAQATGVGSYMLGTPAPQPVCDLFPDPCMRAQNRGAATCDFPAIVDMSTELRGTARKYSKCAAYYKLEKPCSPAPLTMCGSEVTSEDTRMSNPPCTLRGQGVNRWEWLPRDPQATALLPFSTNVSNRLLAKDNHRPCLAEPIDQEKTFFNLGEDGAGRASATADAADLRCRFGEIAAGLYPPGTTELLNRPTWRSPEEIRALTRQ